MLAFSGSNSSGKRRIPGAAVFGLMAGALLLGACDDGRVFKEQSQQGQTAKLVVPDTLTPPVRIAPVAGAPASWKLHERVAEALRQRDIPAGVKMRGDHVYTLRGKVVQINRTGAQSQVTVKWRLLDGSGKQVGEVTQMAAIPNTQTGTNKGGSDDVTQAMADAAAESLSPIVPSSRLRTSQQAMTGLPGPRTRRNFEKRNPVTAIGKGQKKQTRLGRNLMKPNEGGDGKAAARAAGGGGKSKTALGRRGGGKSPLSRNLMRRNPLRVPPGARKALPNPGGKTPAKTPAKTRGTASRRSARAERVSGTTSDARRAAAAPAGKAAPAGSMEELIRRNPTRAEREAGIVSRRPAAKVTAERKPAAPPQARRSREIAARTEMRRSAARKAKPRRARVTSKAVYRSRKRTSRPVRRYRTARDVVPGRRVYWVQIGSYRSRGVAERHWRQARRSGGATLRAANRRIMRAKIGARGVFYRVQVGPYTKRLAAYSVCRTLRDRNIDCFLYRETEQASLPVTRAGGPASRRVTRAILKSKPRRAAQKQRGRKASRDKGVRVRITDGPRISPDPRPDRNPVSTSPGLPGLKN